MNSCDVNSVIDFARRRLDESVEDGSDYETNYWRAYLDGAEAASKAIYRIEIAGKEIDPCAFKLDKRLKNVTVEILECPQCGKVSIGWKRQEDTEDITGE